MADPNLPPDIPEQFIKELAAAGAICETCGGIHQVSIDQLILALPTGRYSRDEHKGIELPWCTCSPCPACGPWKDQAAALAERIQREREGELAR